MSNGTQTITLGDPPQRESEAPQEDLTGFLKRVGARPASSIPKTPEKPAAKKATAKKIAPEAPPLPLGDFLKKVGARPAPPPQTENKKESDFGTTLSTYGQQIKGIFLYPADVIRRSFQQAGQGAKSGREQVGGTLFEIPATVASDFLNAWTEQLDRRQKAGSSYMEHPSLESMSRYLGQNVATLLPLTTGGAGAALGPMVGAAIEEPDPYVGLGKAMAVVTLAGAPQAARATKRVAGRAVEVGRQVSKGGLRRGVQEVTGTGPRLIEKAEQTRATEVAEQEVGYQENLDKAKAKQAELTRSIEEKHTAKVDKIKQEYAEDVKKVGEQKLAKSKAEAKRTALGRLSARLGQAYDENVKSTHTAVRTWLNDRWNDLRAKVGGDTPTDLVPVQKAVLDAQKNILRGSAENIAIFKSILKEGNPMEEASVFKGSKVPGTINISDLPPEVRARIGLTLEDVESTEPVSIGFNDARGYFSELGTKMNTGHLPGDVYRAIKSVREALDKQIQKVANGRGAGPEYSNLKADWSQYMDTFHDMRPLSIGGSALARSLRAADVPFSASPMLGPAGGRAIQAFSRYKKFGADTELGARLRRADTEMKGLPKQLPRVGTVEKPVPGWMESPQVPPLESPARPVPPAPVDPLAITKERLGKSAEAMRKPSPWAIGLGGWEALRGKFPLWWIYVIAKPFLGTALESDRLAKYLSETPGPPKTPQSGLPAGRRSPYSLGEPPTREQTTP